MTPLTYLAAVLALGILAQWLAWRFRLPSILLLLAFGFGLSAATGTRIDDFMPEQTLLAITGLFVSIILFEGGLTLKFSELKQAGTPVVRLCTWGVLIAGFLSSVAANLVFGWDWRVAALLGSILVVTGPTVVGPLLRLIKPTRKVASIVKWEGIVVDPIGAVAAVLVFQVAISAGVQDAIGDLLKALFLTLIVGFGLAFVLGKVIEQLLKHHLIPDYLESVFLLAVVGSSFALSNAIQAESGLLTVTLLGIALANQKSVSVKQVLEFKEHLRVLIISLLFILLSGRIELASLQSVLIPGLVFLAILILIVRPASVLLSNLGSKQTTFRENLFLAALAPRGIVAAAVASIFALEFSHAAEDGKMVADIAEQADKLVPVTFIVIIGTVLIYGLLAVPLARTLGVAAKSTRGVLFAGADRWTRMLAKALQDDGHPVLLLDTKYENVASAKMAGLNAIRANILSEYVEENLELTGIGQLIAATPNDEINTMAAQEFGHLFGKANCWQLTPSDSDGHHSKAVDHRQRARLCFLNGPKFRDLEATALRGATLKNTQLTEVFTLEDFISKHGPETRVLFLNDPEKGLMPFETETKSIADGTKIYALVPEEQPSLKEDETAQPMGL
ncbi:cation:proton antiporter [Roseibacillus persicicus]|uniref:Sodium:hydrogen antiporter n=1 Tax=Roseibacillus persicicus TaxID=454148 RepID=A0A918TLW7_9BACT|nr:sodium:proton antiporter [Roseibacillus persicicus]MDQ8191664.1 sodium:proton antiporter [Roseibacillus persicicus]GHC51751.1 sodium:hydrogen antiporter [Roseibacillus persicicus]